MIGNNIVPAIAVLCIVLFSGCGYRLIWTPDYPMKPDVQTTLPQQGYTCFNYVYMDREQIHEKAREVYERDGYTFDPRYRFYGFFDYKTRTLYCELFDDVVCGHELFHATHGDWHY